MLWVCIFVNVLLANLSARNSFDFNNMDKRCVSLREITGYFDSWREAKQECMNEKELRKLFTTLSERYADFNSSDCIGVLHPAGKLRC